VEDLTIKVGGQRQSKFDFGFGVLKKKVFLIVSYPKYVSLDLKIKLCGNMTQLLFNSDNVYNMGTKFTEFSYETFRYNYFKTWVDTYVLDPP